MSRKFDYDDFDDFYGYEPERHGAGKWVALFIAIVLLIVALGAIIVKVYDIVPTPDTGDDAVVTTTVAPSTTAPTATEAPATSEAPVTTEPPTLPDGPNT